jgi:uncharacterized membrane protein
MIDSIYNLVAMFGYTHPLHPALVHLPMGLVIGAVLFSFAAIKWPHKHLTTTASHCIVLALIFIVPVYITGVLDWQYGWGGDVSGLYITKLVLGAILTCALAYTVFRQTKGASNKELRILYLVCLAICAGLGHTGGEIVYPGWYSG